MSKVLVIVLSPNDTEINKLDYSKKNTINGKLTNGKCCVPIRDEKKVILYKNTWSSNSFNNKMDEIKNEINAHESVVLYHSSDNKDKEGIKNKFKEVKNIKFLDIYSSSTCQKLLNKIVALLESICANSDIGKKFDEIWDECVKKNDKELARLFRSQILTPFVALHLALQMESDMLDEEKEHCKKVWEDGLELIKNNGQELNAKFMELLGLSKNISPNRIKPQPEKELDEFIEKYKDRLYTIFEGLSVNNTFVLNENENVDNLLAGIEQLSKIVEEGISCKEAIKKNRVLRHNIENAITRLGLFTAPFSDKREGLRKELNDLNVNLSSFDTDMIRKYFNMDMKNEFDSSIRLIQGYDGAGSDDKILNMIKELISSLQKIVTVTLNVAPR